MTEKSVRRLDHPLAVAIRVAIAQRGISARKLAHETGMSEPTVLRLVNGFQTDLPLRKARRLSDATGLTLAELAGLVS